MFLNSAHAIDVLLEKFVFISGVCGANKDHGGSLGQPIKSTLHFYIFEINTDNS